MLFSICSVSVSLTQKASLLCVDINKFCSPTRTSLQSGRWAYNLGTSSGIIDNGHPANLPLSESTVADELAELGYRNYAIGKWDCGMTTPSMTPTGRGYHHYVGYYNAAEEYFTHITGAYCGRGPSGAAYPCPSCPGLDFHNDTQDSDGKPVLRPLHDYTTYSTELYAQEAARIIDSHASGQAKGPFYIYAAFQVNRAPITAGI